MLVPFVSDSLARSLARSRARARSLQSELSLSPKLRALDPEAPDAPPHSESARQKKIGKKVPPPYAVPPSM